MSAAELTDTVREIMADTFGVDEAELPGDVSQQTYARWSSLYHMTLIIALEEHFSTAFSMEEMPEMTSVSKIVSVLEQHGVGVLR